MADYNGRVKVDGVVDKALTDALNDMGNEVRQVVHALAQLKTSSKSTVNAAGALNTVLKQSADASSHAARSTSNLVKNQAVLSAHFHKTKVAADQLSTALSTNTSLNNAQRASVNNLVTALRSQVAVENDLKRMVRTQDIQKQAAAYNALATRVSYAGNRISMALTAPIALWLRSSFANYRRLETETIRTTKLISDSYETIETAAQRSTVQVVENGDAYIENGIKVLSLEGALKRLGKGLDEISLEFGVARELVQAVAGDFAELGIESIEALERLTLMTAAVEKLGNVDITQSQEFIKSMYQTLVRVRRDQGILTTTTEDYLDVIEQLNGQLAIFNMIENKTALSLRDIAKGFPELTAASTSFGLSMTEAAALLVPMVSAGFQLGASANSVKVSLQRLIATTKQNSEMIKTLKENYKDFNVESGVGIGSIQKLADSFNAMKRGALGAQGTLEFFARLFGVRQGPRMEVAVQNMAQFQEQITEGLSRLDGNINAQETVEGNIARRLEGYIRSRAAAAGLGAKYSEMQITKFEDFSRVIKLSQSGDEKIAKAFTEARTDIGKFFLEEQKKGNDQIGKIQTESGRVLITALQGGGKETQAAEKYREEVERSLRSAEVRYQRARETLKAISREFVSVFSDILGVITPILQKVATFISSMPSAVKKIIGFSLILVALIGPATRLVGAFYQLRSSLFSIAANNPFRRMKEQMFPIQKELLTSSDLLFKFRNRLTQVGDSFYLKATIKEFKMLERAISLANGSARQVRKAEKIFRKLGVDPRSAPDFSGLMPQARMEVEAALAGMTPVQQKLGLGGYYKEQVNRVTGLLQPEVMVEAAAIGRGMAEEFLNTLRLFGFDPSSAVPMTPPPPPSGGSGGGGRGRRGGGGGSGGGSGGLPPGVTPKTIPGGSGATTPAPTTPPSPTTTTRPVVPTPTTVTEPIEDAVEMVTEALDEFAKMTKKELIALAESIGLTKVSGLSIKSGKLKTETLRNAIRKAMESITEPVETAVEAVEAVAETAKKTRKSRKTAAPPDTKAKVEKGVSLVTDVAEDLDRASEELAIVAEEVKTVIDAKPTKVLKKQAAEIGARASQTLDAVYENISNVLSANAVSLVGRNAQDLLKIADDLAGIDVGLTDAKALISAEYREIASEIQTSIIKTLIELMQQIKGDAGKGAPEGYGALFREMKSKKALTEEGFAEIVQKISKKFGGLDIASLRDLATKIGRTRPEELSDAIKGVLREIKGFEGQISQITEPLKALIRLVQILKRSTGSVIGMTGGGGIGGQEAALTTREMLLDEVEDADEIGTSVVGDVKGDVQKETLPSLAMTLQNRLKVVEKIKQKISDSNQKIKNQLQIVLKLQNEKDQNIATKISEITAVAISEYNALISQKPQVEKEIAEIEAEQSIISQQISEAIRSGDNEEMNRLRLLFDEKSAIRRSLIEKLSPTMRSEESIQAEAVSIVEAALLQEQKLYRTLRDEKTGIVADLISYEKEIESLTEKLRTGLGGEDASVVISLQKLMSPEGLIAEKEEMVKKAKQLRENWLQSVKTGGMGTIGLQGADLRARLGSLETTDPAEQVALGSAAVGEAQRLQSSIKKLKQSKALKNIKKLQEKLKETTEDVVEQERIQAEKSLQKLEQTLAVIESNLESKGAPDRDDKEAMQSYRNEIAKANSLRSQINKLKEEIAQKSDFANYKQTLEQRIEIEEQDLKNAEQEIKKLEQALKDLNKAFKDGFGIELIDPKTGKVIDTISKTESTTTDMFQLLQTLQKNYDKVGSQDVLTALELIDKDGEMTISALKDLGASSYYTSGRAVKTGSVRITGDLLRNIAKKLKIKLPGFWENVADILDNTDFSLASVGETLQFITSLFERVPLEALEKSLIERIPQLTSVEGVLGMDVATIKSLSGMQRLGATAFVPSGGGSASKLSAIFRKAAGAQGGTEKVVRNVEARKPLDDAAEALAIAANQSIAEEIDGFLTLYEERRRMMIFDLVTALQATKSIDVKEEKIDFLTNKIDLLRSKRKSLQKDFGALTTDADVVAIDRAIEENLKLIEELNQQILKIKSLRQRASGTYQNVRKYQIDRIRQRRIADPGVAGSGPIYESGQRVAGVSEAEFQARKEPNPYLEIRPQQIPASVSEARRKILNLVKGVRSGSIDKDVAENLIATLTIIIDDYQKSKAQYWLYETEELQTLASRIRTKLGAGVRISPQEKQILSIVEEMSQLGITVDEMTSTQLREYARALEKIRQDLAYRSISYPALSESMMATGAVGTAGEGLIPFVPLTDLMQGVMKSLSAAVDPNAIIGSYLDKIINPDAILAIFDLMENTIVGVDPSNVKPLISALRETLVGSMSGLQDFLNVPILEMQTEFKQLALLINKIDESIDPTASFSDVYKQIKDIQTVFSKIGVDNPLTEIFGRIVLLLKEVDALVVDDPSIDIDKALKQAVEKINSRLIAAAERARKAVESRGESATPTPSVKATAKTADLGFGISRDERLALAERIKQEIIATGVASQNFLEFQSDTLRYILRAFDVRGKAAAGTSEKKVQALVAKLQEMDIAVDASITSVAIKPVEEAADRVKPVAVPADVVTKPAEVVKEVAEVVEKKIESVKEAVADVVAEVASTPIPDVADEFEGVILDLIEEFYRIESRTSEQIMDLIVQLQKFTGRTYAGTDVDSMIATATAELGKPERILADSINDIRDRLSKIETSTIDQLEDLVGALGSLSVSEIDGVDVVSWITIVVEEMENIERRVKTEMSDMATGIHDVSESIEFFGTIVDDELDEIKERVLSNINASKATRAARAAAGAGGAGSGGGVGGGAGGGGMPPSGPPPTGGTPSGRRFNWRLAGRIAAAPFVLPVKTAVAGQDVGKFRIPGLVDLFKKSAITFIASLERTMIEGAQATATVGQQKAAASAKKMFDFVTSKISGLVNMYGGTTMISGQPLNIPSPDGGMVTNPALLTSMFRAGGIDVISTLDSIRVAFKTFASSTGTFAKHVVFAHLRVLELGMAFVPFGTTIFNVIREISAGLPGLRSAVKSVRDAMDAAGAAGKSRFGAAVGTITSGAGGVIKGGIQRGTQGFSGGLKKAGAGIQRQAMFASSGLINQLTYQMGAFGMVADQAMTSLVQGLLKVPKVGIPILAVIGLIVSGIFVIKRTIGQFGDAGKAAMDNFKTALLAIKDIGIAMIAPFFDMFATFLGAGKEGESTVTSLGEGLQEFSEKVKDVALKIQEFVEKYVVPVIETAVEAFIIIAGGIKRIVGGVILLVRGLFEKFKGDSTKGGEMIGKAFKMIGAGILQIFKGLFKWFGTIWAPLIIELITLLAVTAVNILEQIPIGIVNLLRWSLKALNNIFFESLKFLAKGLGWLPGIGGKIRGALQSMQNGVSGAIDGIANKVNGVVGKISGIPRFIGNKAKDGVKDLAGKIDAMMPGVGKGLLDEFLKSFKDPKAADAAGKAIAEAVTNATKQAKEEVRKSFYDAVVSNLSNTLSQLGSELIEALNEQKDTALKVFDDQIAGIEALAEAEERLTKTEEYEADKRRRRRERELQQSNYQKNRALAIYEGRIDDARGMDLEELKNQQDFTEEMKNVENQRARELQEYNRGNAIAVIRRQREEASKIFDESIKELEEFIQTQTQLGAISQEDFEKRFDAIAKKAGTTSTAVTTAFQNLFTSLPTLIQQGMDPSTGAAGFFSTGLDSLISAAKLKFGLDTGTGSDASSILGLTNQMLSGQSTSIQSAFQSGGIIQTAYGDGLDALNTYVAGKLNKENPESLQNLFEKAIKEANDTIQQELLKAETGAGSAMASLVKRLNKEVEKLAIKEAVKKAIKEAKEEIQKEASTDSTASDGKQIVSGFWLKRRGSANADWEKIIGKTREWIDSLDKNKFSVIYSPGVKPKPFFKGGAINYAGGGPTFGPMHQGIPAVLHGGEYVVRKSAVDKYGTGMLQNINQGIFDKTKGYFKGGIVDESTGKRGTTGLKNVNTGYKAPTQSKNTKGKKDSVGDKIKYAVQNPGQFAGSANTTWISYTDPLRDQKIAKVNAEFGKSNFGKGWLAAGKVFRFFSPAELIPVISSVAFGKDIETGQKLSGKDRLKGAGILAATALAIATGAAVLKPLVSKVIPKIAPSIAKIAPKLTSKVSNIFSGSKYGDELYARMQLGNATSKTGNMVGDMLGLGSIPEFTKLGSYIQGQVKAPFMQRAGVAVSNIADSYYNIQRTFMQKTRIGREISDFKDYRRFKKIVKNQPDYEDMHDWHTNLAFGDLQGGELSGKKLATNIGMLPGSPMQWARKYDKRWPELIQEYSLYLPPMPPSRTGRKYPTLVSKFAGKRFMNDFLGKEDKLSLIKKYITNIKNRIEKLKPNKTINFIKKLKPNKTINFIKKLKSKLNPFNININFDNLTPEFFDGLPYRKGATDNWFAEQMSLIMQKQRESLQGQGRNFLDNFLLENAVPSPLLMEDFGTRRMLASILPEHMLLPITDYYTAVSPRQSSENIFETILRTLFKPQGLADEDLIDSELLFNQFVRDIRDLPENELTRIFGRYGQNTTMLPPSQLVGQAPYLSDKIGTLAGVLARSYAGSLSHFQLMEQPQYILDLITSIIEFGGRLKNEQVLWRGVRDVEPFQGLGSGDVFVHQGALRTATGPAVPIVSAQAQVSVPSPGVLFGLRTPEGTPYYAQGQTYIGEREILLPPMTPIRIDEIKTIRKPYLIGEDWAESSRLILGTVLPGLDTRKFDINAFTRIGPQQGYNEGGLYSLHGVKFYIKKISSKAAAINEEMAARLYEGFDIKTVGQRMAVGVDGSSYYIISKMDESLMTARQLMDETLSGSLPSNTSRKLIEELPVDLLLGAYDLIGPNMDNLLFSRDLVYPGFRVDTGASLMYRGTGGPKNSRPGIQFGNVVEEIFALFGAHPEKHPSLSNLHRFFEEIGLTPTALQESIYHFTHKFSRNADIFLEYIRPRVYSSAPNPNIAEEYAGILKSRFEYFLKFINEGIDPTQFPTSRMYGGLIPNLFKGGIVKDRDNRFNKKYNKKSTIPKLGGIAKEYVSQIGEKFTNAKQKATNEWRKQKAAGYANEEYWNAIGRAETGVDSTGRTPRWQKGGKFGGGLGIANEAWVDYGGKDFAPLPGMATSLQQMVIANRIAFSGHRKKWSVGSSQFPAGMNKFFEPKGVTGWGVVSRKKSVPTPDKFIGDYYKTGLGNALQQGFFKSGKTRGGADSMIPAILHGGEYVINKNSVDKYGLDILNRINKGIFNGAKQYKIGGYVSGIKTPEIPKYIPPMASYARISSPGISTMPSSSETTHNYNFYVDNFIGEQEWFNSMMKEYNVKVVPANQKQAGLESRVVRTYNGLNRGM